MVPNQELTASTPTPAAPTSAYLRQDDEPSRSDGAELALLMFAPCEPMAHAGRWVDWPPMLVFAFVAVLYVGGIVSFAVGAAVDDPLVDIGWWFAVPLGWLLFAFGPVVTLAFDGGLWFARELRSVDCGHDDTPDGYGHVFNLSTSSVIFVVVHWLSQVVLMVTAACLRCDLDWKTGTDAGCCHWTYSCCCPACSLAGSIKRAKAMRRQEQPHKPQTDEIPAYSV